MIRKQFVIGLVIFLAVVGIVFAFLVPIRQKEGIIDTTSGMCMQWPTSVKRYHLLLGQREDYNLVAKHIAPIYSAKPVCGQYGDFRLYLL